MSSLVAKSATASVAVEDSAAKKTRGGRKSKNQWRKDIDLVDVEDGLEERREEERQGGLIEERQDADLFVMDVAGDEKEKRKQKQKKKLRLDEILGKRSGVKIPVIGSKMGEERKRRQEEHAVRQRLKKIAGLSESSSAKAQNIKAKQASASYDIWGMPNASDAKQSKRTSGNMSREKLKHLSLLPAVEVAHPGASYMPTEKDHKDLINIAGAECISKMRVAEKYKNVSTKHTVDPVNSMNECAEIVARELDANAAGVRDSDSDSDADLDSDASAALNNDSTVAGSDVNEYDDDSQPQTSADPKRKTRAERNKQRRAAQRLNEERSAKELKKHLHQLEMSKRLGGKVDVSLEKAEAANEKKRKQAEEKAKQPLKRIGKHNVPMAPTAVKLTEELPKSLRELAPETNGFSEVYSSLVRRNFVEPPSAKRAKKFVSKKKTTEKWSYKDFV
ncbi:hypothetical protein IW140_000036 [Coemansia sp. RSA 1813]|nr:hypothetical protein EV178_000162 [Coemansia sp. RSA 1646]KAJ1771369.1 hypothetical protein LPJ74_002409 [Coemansia sp. RSA 1843]KAJ2217592.1 hypothetical protein EV179_000427 [Coemansia sp. RSA 487]KAJ2573395.1 hypothetical protein IW140_000036 [Coemansia sp. RSA 1813]